MGPAPADFAGSFTAGARDCRNGCASFACASKQTASASAKCVRLGITQSIFPPQDLCRERQHHDRRTERRVVLAMLQVQFAGKSCCTARICVH